MTMSLTANATQVTQVEQARAVAEVAAAVQAAQNNHRDESAAMERLASVCRRRSFAERAMFGFRRGTERIAGPTIEFAIEAARCWGNMASGSVELVRVPGTRETAGHSEMLAFAWDEQTNFQRRVTYVNPHVGYVDSIVDKQGNDKEQRVLYATRDVRENNASTASRVEREQILAVLPVWYVEDALAIVHETLTDKSGDVPVEARRRDLIERFGNLGVRRQELVDKIGAPVDQWLPIDLARLDTLGRSITQGRTTVAAEFHADGGLSVKTPRTTLADLAPGSGAPVAEREAGAAEDATDDLADKAEPAAESTPESEGDTTSDTTADTADTAGSPPVDTSKLRAEFLRRLRTVDVGNRNEYMYDQLKRPVEKIGDLGAEDLLHMIDDLRKRADDK